jgi:hypothetical protein
MKRFRIKIMAVSLSVLAGLFQGALTAHAQEGQDNGAPKPAGKAIAPPPAEDDQDQEQAIPAMQPDDRPLVGIQDLVVGTPPETHSYWYPGFSYTNIAASNGQLQGGGTGWYSTSILTGNVSLLENWSTAQLSLNYSGGESLSTNSTIGDSQYHQLGVFQTISWSRVRLTLLDQFAYLPASQFGFGAGTGLAFPGAGGTLAPILPGLANGFTPNQSIFNTIGPRYSNSGGLQVNFLLSPRSSLTIGGVFGILRFIDAGNIESNQTILNAGYNYQVNRSDTLGLSYKFSAYEYLASPQAIGDHTVLATYGKRITGRLAMKLSLGPEITTFRVAPGVTPSTEHNAVAGNADLSYLFAAGGLDLSYNHSVNNGSGILLGATADTVTLSGNHKLGRVWTANVSFGYARNTPIVGTTGVQAPVYDSVFVGAGVLRPLSRTSTLTVNYLANIQTSSTGTCPGPTCANFNSNQITLGLSWRAAPFVLH